MSFQIWFHNLQRLRWTLVIARFLFRRVTKMSNSEDIQHKASELKAERGDWLHATVKGAIAAVPFAGGIGAEFFELVIVPPLAKRRDELLTMIASGLSEVQGQIADFSGSNLSNN